MLVIISFKTRMKQECIFHSWWLFLDPISICFGSTEFKMPARVFSINNSCENLSPVVYWNRWQISDIQSLGKKHSSWRGQPIMPCALCENKSQLNSDTCGTQLWDRYRVNMHSQSFSFCMELLKQAYFCVLKVKAQKTHASWLALDCLSNCMFRLRNYSTDPEDV
jgi:hypothetical protein